MKLHVNMCYNVITSPWARICKPDGRRFPCTFRHFTSFLATWFLLLMCFVSPNRCVISEYLIYKRLSCHIQSHDILKLRTREKPLSIVASLKQGVILGILFLWYIDYLRCHWDAFSKIHLKYKTLWWGLIFCFFHI